jgi:hypothetical protein
MLQPLIWVIVGRPEDGPAPNLEWKAFKASRTGIRRLRVTFGPCPDLAPHERPGIHPKLLLLHPKESQ